MAAEGGTEFNHSEVVFRSDAVTGPYTPGENNPILTQRQLDPGRPSPVTSTGHADLVRTPVELLASRELDSTLTRNGLQLKIVAKGSAYSFYYEEKKNAWQSLKENVDAKFLSTRVAGGFVGCMYALYATSLGQPTHAKAYFDWFSVSGP